MSEYVGVVYLLHFSGALKHARHYIGFCDKYENLDKRFEYHQNGSGSKLLAAVCNSGRSFELVRLWRGTRNDERALKNCHGAKPYCPICSGAKRIRRGLTELDV